MEGATSTLADNLLDDLDDLSDAVEDQDDEGQPKEQKRDDNGDEGDDDDDDDDAVNKKASPPQAGLTNDLPRLLQDASLRSHLTAIRAWGVQNPSNSKEDAEREYKLIVKSNKWLARLGDELVSTHVTLRQVYDAKFPELADLLPDARQYQQAVEVIGNETDMTKVNDSLHEFLTANQVITLTVAGSTTAGRLLTEAELQRCQELAHYMNQIHETQNELTDFVASRMQDLAPAVCALTGPEVAAKLIALAGGLVELSVIPACNLQVMGQSKQTSTSRAGFGSQAAQPHMGLLMHAPLVQSVPQGERRKVLKWLAAKVALAARCDATAVQQRRPRSALPGERFREELQKKIQVLQTPDQAPVLKALPKPDLKVRKRRGGKRIRRLKERFEETAMMKQANTRAFSVQAGDYDDDAMGLTRGLLDTEDATLGGNVRRQTEKRKMRQANTKASRKKAAQMDAAVKRHQQSNGLASTVTFTPMQGMELVNPDAQKDRVRQANQKWFTENAGFKSALPKK